MYSVQYKHSNVHVALTMQISHAFKQFHIKGNCYCHKKCVCYVFRIFKQQLKVQQVQLLQLLNHKCKVFWHKVSFARQLRNDYRNYKQL